MPYGFIKAITINHAKVPNTDQANFPVCISGVLSYLATVGNGGAVQSTNGYDIVFAADSAGATILSFERFQWSALSGQCEFWVKIPTVSHSTDTVIYLLYGNSAITTDQQNKTGTWDTNFKGVYHVPAGTTPTLADSTSNAGTFGAVPTSGAGFGALQNTTPWVNDGRYGSAISGGYPTGTAQRTLETWVKIGSGVTTFMCLAGIGQTFAVVAYAVFCVLYNTNSLSIDIYTDSTSVAWTPDGNWHHVAAVFPSGATTTNQAKLYIDGVLQSTSGGSHTLASLGQNLSVGVFPDHSTGLNFTGSTAELRVSNIARSGDWIAAHYNNVSSPSTFYTIGPPPPTQRGNVDYDQIRSAARQGRGAKFQMFGTSATVTGHVAVYDADGNVIDSGSSPGAAVPILPVRSASANTTVLVSDYTVIATTPSITITLPASPATGQIFNVKNGNSTAGQTITVSAAVNIDTATTVTLGATASLTVQWDGTIWRIL